MDRNTFDSLPIEDKINYINGKLSEGETVTQIREGLNLGEKTLQRLIKKAGYSYNQKIKKYVKSSTNIIQSESSITNIIPNIKDDLLEIIEMKEDLKKLIKQYKEGYDKEHTSVIEVIVENNIKIDLPDAEIVRTTVRVNKDVLDCWNKFCNINKEFSKTDLLSSCMKEFIDKYNKSKGVIK